MRQRSRIALCALGAWAVACHGELDPTSRLCTQVLERKLPRAREIEVAADPTRSRATLSFEAARGASAPTRGQLECVTEASGSEGGLRLRAATLDGRALPDAELAVINADLLLADLRRADPYRRR